MIEADFLANCVSKANRAFDPPLIAHLDTYHSRLMIRDEEEGRSNTNNH